ncbi:MAG: hypothetical protein M3Y58_01135 [Chloroflexota bacterium]|nr:hypothetical protein [Chloroflexota bacterium]
MSTDSPQTPPEEASRFKDAMRRILSLTPEQREEVKRKVAEEAENQKPKKDSGKRASAAPWGKKNEDS